MIIRSGYQHIVADDFVNRVREMRAWRSERLASLKTKSDALAFQEEVRLAVESCYGPWPEKCDLNPVIAGVLERDGYIIEKIRYCSRPDFWVTGNFYIPAGAKGALPTVLEMCGHSQDGKACDTYQEVAIRLVKNGFCVLMIDPIQQGERLQYAGVEETGIATSLCPAHNVMGNQLQLFGEFFGSWRIWDGKRAIDYLLTRPEVDPKWIGITGNSGGGTLTEWTWANDDRLAFAAPSCHITTFLRNLENELPTDAEQCPPGVLSAGLEMVDMMICQAPKPVIMMGQRYDFFERRGLEEAYKDLKRFYALLGAEDNLQMFVGPTTHGYSVHNQETMVSFFRKAAGLPGESVRLDAASLVLADKELNVCPEGGTVNVGSKSVYTLVKEMAQTLAKGRVAPSKSELRKAIAEVLALPDLPVAAPYFRILRNFRINEEPWGRFAVETERDIRAILRVRRPQMGIYSFDIAETVRLYLPHYSSQIEIAEYPELFAPEENVDICALDVRGLGESLPDEHNEKDFWQAYGMDYMLSAYSLMFGESYLGRRVYDVLRTLELLSSEGTRKVELIGRGQGAIMAAFVGCLSDKVTSVTLYDAPKSYQEWAEAPVCNWPMANIPFNVLATLDLPDLYKALGEKLTIKSTWNALMKP